MVGSFAPNFSAVSSRLRISTRNGTPFVPSPRQSRFLGGFPRESRLYDRESAILRLSVQAVFDAGLYLKDFVIPHSKTLSHRKRSGPGSS